MPNLLPKKCRKLVLFVVAVNPADVDRPQLDEKAAHVGNNGADKYPQHLTVSLKRALLSRHRLATIDQDGNTQACRKGRQ